MKILFVYQRLDEYFVECEISDHFLYGAEGKSEFVITDSGENVRFTVLKKSDLKIHEDELKELICDYNSVKYITENDKSWVVIGASGGKRKIKLSQEIFNEKIECEHVMINSVTEFIRCVDYFRIIGLATHAISVLEHARRQGNDNEKKYISEIIVKLQEDIETENSIVKNAGEWENGLYNYHPRNAIVEKLEELYPLKYIPEYSKNEIKRSVHYYQSGGSLCYYRGLGRTIFPEEPGIFRESRKREEDRWYREMRIQFQNELEKKPYLDRLAMLQHYELPTRLLDVTSNPLVALYMTANTIYTGDPDQRGTGEVVVYYDGFSDDDLNNNYGNDLSYVYDGKAYDSGIILVIAALVKLKYENKERMKKVISTFQRVINYIEPKGCRRREQLCEIINRCVHANAACYEKVYYFSAEEKNSLTKYKILKRMRFENPEDILGYLWNLAKKGGMPEMAENEEIIVNKREFIREYYGFISSYRYLLSTVRRENCAYRDHINVFDLMKSFHVKIGRTNDRIQAQSGSFIICGLDSSYIKEKMTSSRSKEHVRFFVNNKITIMKELNALGINDSTMLPDMAHHASYLKLKRI